jgi:hypothetical protein
MCNNTPIHSYNIYLIYCVKSTLNTIIGFLTFWFGVTLSMYTIYMGQFQETLWEAILITLRGLVIPVIIMLYGMSRMIGLKFSLPYEFWKGDFGGGYPLYFGAVLDFFIGMASIAVLCVMIIIRAPFLVQKLVALLIGTTVICVLLYFRVKKYEAIKALIGSIVHSSG